MAIVRCEDCRYFDRDYASACTGACHRKSPGFWAMPWESGMREVQRDAWPLVSEKGWCGEGKRKDLSNGQA
jgi:hypothetical protein